MVRVGMVLVLVLLLLLLFSNFSQDLGTGFPLVVVGCGLRRTLFEPEKCCSSLRGKRLPSLQHVPAQLCDIVVLRSLRLLSFGNALASQSFPLEEDQSRGQAFLQLQLERHFGGVR